MLSEFHFVSPLWLIGIFVIFIGFITTRHKALKSPSIIRPISLYYPLLVVLESQHSHHKHKNSRLWLGISFSLLFFSLAQPAFKTAIKNTGITQQNVDLILVVNTSVSMVLRDYKEQNTQGDVQQFDRMAKTKHVLAQLVKQFKGKRIGLVVLGRPASVWLPLTGDKNQIHYAIDKLQTTLGGRTSDMGATLQLVGEQFNHPSEQQKMVLLVNDGYLQIGAVSPIESVKALVSKHFIVHSLAIGSPKRPKFSLGIGHLIYAPVDLKLMQSLALAGQGSMVHAWHNNAVDELLNAIDIPNTKPTASLSRVKNTALYFYPLSLALFILLAMVFPISRIAAVKQS